MWLLCRESQVELREHIDSLAAGNLSYGVYCMFTVNVCHNHMFCSFASVVSAELCRINEQQKVALDLDPYVKKLLNARRRVVLVNNILQNAQVSGECWKEIC